jgi:hypothetical protein
MSRTNVGEASGIARAVWQESGTRFCHDSVDRRRPSTVWRLHTVSEREQDFDQRIKHARSQC